MPEVAPTDRRAPADTLVSSLLFVFLVALFLVLGAAYGGRFPLMATQFDVWFRTDVNHYMHWVKDPAFAYRFPLHPATLLVLKPYSLLVGRILPLDARLLALFALPVVLVNAAVIVMALRLFARGAKLLAVGLVALCVGPLLLLAPIPESHTMGGVSLLMTTVLVWRFLGASPEERPLWQKRLLFWGIAATGFSVSNIVPALLVAYPLWRGYRPTRRQLTVVAAAVGAVLLLGGAQFILKYRAEHDHGNFIAFVLSRLALWLKIPDGTAIARSLRALVMAQFGVPTTSPFSYTSDAGVQYAGVILQDAPNVLQIIAGLCWSTGIFLWFRSARQDKREGNERSLTIGCLLTLLWLLTFHSCFASDEAFMFSVHAWPFVLFPGLFALRSGLKTRNLPALMSLALALLLSLVQTVLALPALFRLPI